MTKDTQKRGSDQAGLWNGVAGRAWVDTQDVLDKVFQPFEEMLSGAVRDRAAKRVLDVGCGTGSTSVAIARSLSRGGECTGIDISQPMIDAARLRSNRAGWPATFLVGDAQTWPFEAASFEAIVSRFGVMFFSDPVLAFRNLRRAATPGAHLLCLAWRSPAENPFMTAGERAAAPLLPKLSPREAGAPGQFAFADPEHVQAILTEAAWRKIEMQPIDVVCSFPETELMRYITRLGPVGLLLAEADEGTRARVVETMRSAFQPFVHGAEVRFTAACWKIQAVAL